MPHHVVPIGGAAIAAWAEGAGHPVVFLHAGVADSRMWRGQFGAIAHHARSVAYDRRGFGETAIVGEPYNQVGDLFAVLDALAPGQPATLVGCSQGGRIAIDAALSHPARVARLVLIAPAISGAPPAELPADIAAEVAALDAAEADGDIVRVNAIEARLWLDGPLAAEGRVAGPMRDLFLDMNGIALAAPAPPLGQADAPESAWDRLEQVAVPTVVAWGTLDFPHVQHNAAAIARRVPGAVGYRLAGVAHLPSMEVPDVILHLVRDRGIG